MTFNNNFCTLSFLNTIKIHKKNRLISDILKFFCFCCYLQSKSAKMTEPDIKEEDLVENDGAEVCIF